MMIHEWRWRDECRTAIKSWQRSCRDAAARDPFQIAKLGIIVLDDCENFGQLKGMDAFVKKKSLYFLESGFKSANRKRIGGAHGDRSRPTAPRTCKGDGLQEFVLYKMNSIPEYEEARKNRRQKSLRRKNLPKKPVHRKKTRRPGLPRCLTTSAQNTI